MWAVISWLPWQPAKLGVDNRKADLAGIYDIDYTLYENITTLCMKVTFLQARPKIQEQSLKSVLQ